MDLASALDVLPQGYRDLFERARRRAWEDDRVRGMWLGGSLARGTADEGSDLDVILAIADDDFDAFAHGWRDWLASITPVVLAEELPFAKGSFYSVTPGFERFDVVSEAVSQLPSTFFPARLPVFDRDDLAGSVPQVTPGAGPSAAAIGALITEYFRVSTPEVVLVRDDWLLAREHLHHLASLIRGLFLECNAPQPPMGVKQWSTRLTTPQRDAMLGLPTVAHDMETLRHAHLLHAEVFLTNAEAAAERFGVEWPHALEDAAADHLRRHLGTDRPHPRTPAALVV